MFLVKNHIQEQEEKAKVSATIWNFLKRQTTIRVSCWCTVTPKPSCVLSVQSQLLVHVDAETSFMNTRHEDFIGKPGEQSHSDSPEFTQSLTNVKRKIDNTAKVRSVRTNVPGCYDNTQT